MLQNKPVTLSALLSFGLIVSSCNPPSSSTRIDEVSIQDRTSSPSTNEQNIAAGELFASEKNLFFADIKWENFPKYLANNHAVLSFLNQEKQPTSDVEILSIEPFMKAHGHGFHAGNKNLSFAKIENTIGVWKIKNINFSMDGPWELNIRARILLTGQEDLLEIKVLVE
ncbi:MAG: hypothetical protein K2X39_08485 [Silvanigrellaceae bacterium]|nr:hypothetical protein [Silvanigrellaceae bacterium]